MNSYTAIFLGTFILILNMSCNSNNHSNTRLSMEQVLEMAKQKATSEGYDLDNFEPGVAKYGVLGEKDKYWFIYFEGKRKTIGNHFSVSIHDVTGKTRLEPGK